MLQVLLIAGALLPLASSITYAWSITRGDTVPQVTTRFLMMAITSLSFISLLAAHDHSGVWLALTSTIQAIGLWLLSLRKGMGSIFNRLDMICLLLCALGILLWLASGQSLVGLFASIAADLIGCVPSIVKTWRLPYSETITFYGLDAVAGICILFSTPITWRSAIFPIYIFLINAVFVAVIAGRRSTYAA